VRTRSKIRFALFCKQRRPREIPEAVVFLPGPAHIRRLGSQVTKAGKIVMRIKTAMM